MKCSFFANFAIQKKRKPKMSTLIRRISVVLLFCSLLLPVHAVLKEANLEKTLSILRGELTHYYNDLEQQAESSKRLREQVIN